MTFEQWKSYYYVCSSFFRDLEYVENAKISILDIRLWAEGFVKHDKRT